MDIFRGGERIMRMTDASWARHANPWSGWTRIAGAVPTFLALWSWHWIGPWALVPIFVIAIWTYANPRLFPAPANTDAWITWGVLGERVFLNRKAVPIPDEHARVALVVTAAAISFLTVAIFGFIAGNFWAAMTGWFGAMLGKCWFVDRMAWLWDDMKGAHPVYAAWDRAEWTASLNDPSAAVDAQTA